MTDPRTEYNRHKRFFSVVFGPTTEVRESTLALVLTLDLRALRPGAAHQLACMSPTFNMIDAAVRAATTFANLRCLVLDGQADANATKLPSQLHRPLQHLGLLSLAHCPVLLPLKLFHAGALAGLTYLDLSYTSGWARSLLLECNSFTVQNLPNLRILKLAGKALDAPTADSVLRAFGHQLWGIDLSCNNKLGDDLIPILVKSAVACHRSARLQSARFFPVEGTLMPAPVVPGTYFVKESDFSAEFNHPDRYLADAPLYTAEYASDGNSLVQPENRTRLKGQESVRGDSATDLIKILAGGPDDDIPVAPEIGISGPVTGAITHLHLNGLTLRSRAVGKLLENNAGWIEHFECDRARYLPLVDGNQDWLHETPLLYDSTMLYGFPGAAHLFRPVYQSNLRVLKIHHSLVTNVPTLSAGTARVLENTWLSEMVFCKQNDLAFPQLFSPDMNPRIYSLTLSHIPRHSTGVVTDRLIHFLKLAAAQEQNIERTKAAMPHRGPPVLRGLRHIRLEFEPDASSELASIDSSEDVSEAMEAFTSFSESAWDLPSLLSSPPARKRSGASVTSSSVPIPKRPSELPPSQTIIVPSEERLFGGPFDQVVEGQYYAVRHRLASNNDNEVEADDKEDVFETRVWIGSGVIRPDNPPAINAYMRNLAAAAAAAAVASDDNKNDDGGSKRGNHLLLRDFAPASPSHVAAGAPAGSYLFWRAWDQMLVPARRELRRRPGMAALRGMGDVLEGIKAFRSGTRGKYHAMLAKKGNSGGGGGGGVASSSSSSADGGEGHGYWTGKLEIDFPHGRTGSSLEGSWG